MEGSRFKRENKTELNKKYIIVIAVSVALIVAFAFLYTLNKKSEKLSVTETATTDYKVYLNNNEFYEKDYLESNKQYVSSLIKNITTNYEYNLNVENTKEYDCTYRVDATLDICDSSTKKSLYTYTENIMQENKLTSNNGQIAIKEEINIDYPHFNDIANRFMDVYALAVTNSSTLKVNLIAKTEYTGESIVTLSVPLNKHTFDIETLNQLASTRIKNATETEGNKVVEIMSILGFLGALLTCVFFIRKLIKILLENRTDEEKYKSNLKKILLSYGEYINKTEDFQFNLDEYEIIRVNTFLDLLKIKEDLSRPILMIENKEKTNAIFAITDNSNFIYMYALNMYQKKLAEKNEQAKINI